MPAKMSCGEYLLIMVGWVAPSALDADSLDCGCQGIRYARWTHVAGVSVGERAPILVMVGWGAPSVSVADVLDAYTSMELCRTVMN